MTRILLDQGLAPRAAAILRRNGFDAVHIAEIGMERAEDILIPDMARTEKRICVTLDHDFHAHLATAGHGVLPLYCSAQKGSTPKARRT
jgi:predicted nuclease of predicted toxin-antitoxin system